MVVHGLACCGDDGVEDAGGAGEGLPLLVEALAFVVQLGKQV